MSEVLQGVADNSVGWDNNEQMQATVLIEHVSDNQNLVFKPNIVLDGKLVDAGAYTTANFAAIAYDLLTCKLNQLTADQQPPPLHFDYAWYKSQPLFSPLLTGSFDDLVSTLRMDTCLVSEFPRNRPLGTLQLVTKLAVHDDPTQNPKSSNPTISTGQLPDSSPSSSREDIHPLQLNQASLNKGIDSCRPPPHFIPPTKQSISVNPKRATVDEVRIATTLPSSAPPTTADTPSSHINVANVRTNWASYPENSGNQAVLLTKFQIKSGNMSIPAGRCHAVIGAFKENCSVILLDSLTVGEKDDVSCAKKYKVSYRCYPSQPTQVFLSGAGLKQFFAARCAKAGDVLVFSPTHILGNFIADVWKGDGPQGIAFKNHLHRGWSDITPPEKNAVTPPQQSTVTPDRRRRKTKQQYEEEKALEEAYIAGMNTRSMKAKSGPRSALEEETLNPASLARLSAPAQREVEYDYEREYFAETGAGVHHSKLQQQHKKKRGRGSRFKDNLRQQGDGNRAYDNDDDDNDDDHWKKDKHCEPWVLSYSPQLHHSDDIDNEEDGDNDSSMFNYDDELESFRAFDYNEALKKTGRGNKSCNPKTNDRLKGRCSRPARHSRHYFHRRKGIPIISPCF